MNKQYPQFDKYAHTSMYAFNPREISLDNFNLSKTSNFFDIVLAYCKLTLRYCMHVIKNIINCDGHCILFK